MNRQEIFKWVKQQYDTEPDYPWKDNNAVLRHKGNRKWYAIVMEVERDKLGLSESGMVEIINVKCEPILIDSLRLKPGFFPAYHMNKSKWISILLDGTIAEKEIESLIGMSYDLTAPIFRKPPMH